jgi:hypothetical protein
MLFTAAWLCMLDNAGRNALFTKRDWAAAF